MELDLIKSEILGLLKKAKTRTAAEKLQTVCKQGTFKYRTVEECLKRINRLESQNKSFNEVRHSDYYVDWAKIDHALIWVVCELSPEELESN